MGKAIKVMARIGLEVLVSEDEYHRLSRYFRGELPLDDRTIRFFMAHGEPAGGEYGSYIPDTEFDSPRIEELPEPEQPDEAVEKMKEKARHPAQLVAMYLTSLYDGKRTRVSAAQIASALSIDINEVTAIKQKIKDWFDKENNKGLFHNREDQKVFLGTDGDEFTISEVSPTVRRIFR